MAGSRARLRRAFYDRPTLQVAEDLIGKVLVHRTADGLASGVIVEVEAYIGEDDPACHAAAGLTRRNAPLYGPPGLAYVYLNYGVHFLFNVVTEAKGHPAAVLIRALEPCEGVSLMRGRRFPLRAAARTPTGESEDGEGRGRQGVRAEPDDLGLCRGPGNLTRALGIHLTDNRTDLCAAAGDLYLEDRRLHPGATTWSPRIGIRVGIEHHWRCYVTASAAVSGRRRAGL